MTKYLLMLLLVASTSVNADDETTASAIFDQMKLLEGVWEKEGTTNSKFSINFELTANDSALVETWNYEGKKHSLTIYHLNGKSVMATHYCPQGNQPRLQLDRQSTTKNISFEYLDATNLESLENSHQHSLSFNLSEPLNIIHRQESYLSKSGEEISELVLVRK